MVAIDRVVNHAAARLDINPNFPTQKTSGRREFFVSEKSNYFTGAGG
jgi:hypothetical protein